ncbi:MAG: rRNA pseudouridine synthase [Thermoguttaceae bacterium]|nr:rRNA pseudouridine synthase [Thermoguttaceae bacterium]MDW8079374.1 pseudouridine synthase [Thermoguttaceae bacterium]
MGKMREKHTGLSRGIFPPVLTGKHRLQKVLAAAGFGSRRKCEELILAGRVMVDGKVVTELGTKVDPEKNKILVDGLPIKIPERIYYAVYKPEGVVCTHRDPSGRLRVIDLVPETDVRLFFVGRLDLHSEGLMLITNDGELAQRLTHPRFGVPKVYRVLVAGVPDEKVLTKLVKGVHFADFVARAKRVRMLKKYKQSAVLEIELCEGHNREIRRMLARFGHKVYKLKRIAIGPLSLGKLKPGQWRVLTPAEVAALRKAAGLKP